MCAHIRYSKYFFLKDSWAQSRNLWISASSIHSLFARLATFQAHSPWNLFLWVWRRSLLHPPGFRRWRLGKSRAFAAPSALAAAPKATTCKTALFLQRTSTVQPKKQQKFCCCYPGGAKGRPLLSTLFPHKCDRLDTKIRLQHLCY